MEKEVVINGLKDFVFCSADVNDQKNYSKFPDVLQTFVINDKDIKAKSVEFRIVYKKESIYLITQPFDY